MPPSTTRSKLQNHVRIDAFTLMTDSLFSPNSAAALIKHAIGQLEEREPRRGGGTTGGTGANNNNTGAASSLSTPATSMVALAALVAAGLITV
jgi:hypothetical protein